jgi:hypothetical protein
MGGRLGWKVFLVVVGCLVEVAWMRARKGNPNLPKLFIRP